MLFYSKQDKAILLFHRVFPERDPLWDPIDPSLFAETLKYMRKNFHVISLDELLFEKNIQSTKPLAALTFDDGYRDFIDFSIPIMDKAGMTASMFIVTDCIDKGMPTWTYIVDHIFAHSAKMEWKGYDPLLLPDQFRKIKWENREAKMNYCRKFKQYIKWIPSTTRDVIVKSLLENFNDVQYPPGMMMNWHEIRQIQSAGFSIGSHSVTHPSLATIKDEDSIRFEMEESANRIKAETAKSPQIFSYPVGSYDERVKKIAEETGYKASLAVDSKMYDPSKQEMFEIPRIELYNESWLKTKMRINGVYGYLKKIYK
ncbi:polysaccharide deacetylase family protein [soil metagenome]